MVVGIVGSEAIKFTAETEQKARELIKLLLTQPQITGFSSGHCHLGGIDIWAEEIGNALLLEPFIYPPRILEWSGYRERNLQIIKASNEVRCITVREYPPNYTGMRFASCYHCGTKDHVKSGGCWTLKRARMLGKRTQLHIID